MSDTYVLPYLYYGGSCQEALEFYQEALGARIDMMMMHNQNPEPLPPGVLQPGFEDKVMHATFHVGQTAIMASDGMNDQSNFGGFSLSIAAPSTEDAERMFAALAESGTVTMPLSKTFWSPLFGTVTDKFGVGWLVTVASNPT